MVTLISSFDLMVLEALYAIRDPFLIQLLIWISELGSWTTVYGLAICAMLVFVVYKKYDSAIGLAISVATSGIGVVALKELTARVRPPTSFQAYLELWYSFPSAHAALSAALYGFLAYLIFRSKISSRMRIVLGSVCLLIVFLVSFSRLYLGVHYFSDVIAGLLLGSAAIFFGIKASKRI